MSLKKSILIIILFTITVIIFAFILNRNSEETNREEVKEEKEIISAPQDEPGQLQAEEPDPEFSPPVLQAKERVAKKPFGIKISPGSSPVQPERFLGYHTGTDFEIFPDEINKRVEVYAICEGEIKQITRIGGYGGVIIQDCTLNGEEVHVLYGHIVAENIQEGETAEQRSVIAVLGADKSRETDGERKHLHLGINRGAVDARGYVNTEEELGKWINILNHI